VTRDFLERAKAQVCLEAQQAGQWRTARLREAL